MIYFYQERSYDIESERRNKIMKNKDITKHIPFGNMQLANGFIRSATNENMAREDHTPSDKLVLYYEELANQEIGMIITGFCFPSIEELAVTHMLGLFDDTQIPAYQYLCEQVHRSDVKILLQIVAGGNHKTRTPQDYSQSEIEQLPQSFADCAKRAYLAGFDGIQLHLAHGYVLSQFLSPNRNERKDMYGGSLEHRETLPLAILDAIRSQVPAGFHISAKLHGSDHDEGGFSLEESLTLAKHLEAHGLDSLEISGGHYHDYHDEGFFYEEACKFADELTIPVFVVGGNKTPSIMAKHFTESNLAGFSMSRALTCDPSILHQLDSSSSCIGCGKCFQLGCRCILNKKHQNLLASDFDGTLSKDHVHVSKENIEAIRTWNLTQIFGLVSGRPTISMEQTCREYHIPYDFIAGFNGALILDACGTILYEKPITQDITDLLEDLRTCDTLGYHVVGKHQVLLNKQERSFDNNPMFEEVLLTIFDVVESLADMDDIYMLSCEFKDQETALKYTSYINERYPYLQASTNLHFIDIMEKGVNKAQAIDFIHSYFHISKENTHVVGDSFNDYDMIKEYHGFAIAGNTMVMSVADHVVSEVHEVIQKHLQVKV